ncbi:feruloyl-CoA synthase [Litorisediminicola beolgyonensis]|uniref:Feruloyl-CoA synthase n=1 Tax=Litorisediminicola beolgyonensis TaxID=1173614 RepID=A0ABW3ZJL8_9RHOB
MPTDTLFPTPTVLSETRDDGTVLVWQEAELGPYPRAITERFMQWAETTPDQVWMAERNAGVGWDKMSYATGAAKIRGIGSGLLEMGLSVERPLLILSGNSIRHGLMALGAQHVGVPSAALAPAYALSKGDLAKLRDVVGQLTPGLIYVEDAGPFARAISEVFDADIPVVAATGTLPDREVIAFDALADTAPSPEMEAAHAAITPDTVAKFLFTSGTTGSPKAVIQTQRLLCSNMEMATSCYAFMRDEPPVLCDWAPWNHTASGNKAFNLAHYNGGSFYIDGGKPAPGAIDETIRNLSEVSPTWYFNVPLGYQMLLDAMERDESLRETFFKRLKIMMYAGAGMSQPIWDRLTRVAEQAVPGGVLLTTAFGSTETGPLAMTWLERQEASGNLGVPVPGVTLKLVPQGDKYEARVKGPAITPGYWRAPELTSEAFDEEGFYSYGDAFRFAEPGDPSKGFYFDGRLAENFKLASGTWVAVGALRAKLANDLKGLASDVVIAGEGRETLGALVVPDWDAMAKLAPGKSGTDLLAAPEIRDMAQELLDAHARAATGSASRVAQMMFLAEPLEFERGELTDKGSINQRAVLRNRPELMEKLYSDDPAVIGV